ncbi:hypothetical protein CSKR_203711 [Clonorchis sinensis]|uniref:Uncharacterized protein n=1 Tax=Clonorchis sinensis TaxID=79923 RepID=A0A8T1N0W7_CLOSI|nr:hypothetical protein CSKR_203711 [Clonorchis sinensis]
MGSPKFKPTMNTATNASVGKLKLLGEFDCEMDIANHRHRGTVYLAARELNIVYRLDRSFASFNTTDRVGDINIPAFSKVKLRIYIQCPFSVDRLLFGALRLCPRFRLLTIPPY